MSEDKNAWDLYAETDGVPVTPPAGQNIHPSKEVILSQDSKTFIIDFDKMMRDREINGITITLPEARPGISYHISGKGPITILKPNPHGK